MEENIQYKTSSLINKAMNTLKIKKPDQNSKNAVEEINAAIEELESIRRYFDAVDEPELLDYAIYREKAALMRLSFLLREAKNKNKSY
jgi:predicted DNA-binding protein (UPF0251 family)